MTAIIFGANGQDGYYLNALLRHEFEVIGIGRDASTDIRDFGQVSELIRQSQPAYIFHLAANSTTRHDALFENHATIATGTLNILEAVKNHSPASKVFISGSGLQFKNEGKPIRETDPFEARDAYSVSRIQSVYAARYFRTLDVKAYVGYFFNHDSPRRSERHMAKKIAEAAKRIAAGSSEKLEVGDMSVVKEWTYAGDIAEGIWKFVTQDAILEANISSGKGYSIQEWIERCFQLKNLKWQDHTITLPSFKSEYAYLVSDPTRIFSLGWRPDISIDELAGMMMAE